MTDRSNKTRRRGEKAQKRFTATNPITTDDQPENTEPTQVPRLNDRDKNPRKRRAFFTPPMSRSRPGELISPLVFR